MTETEKNMGGWKTEPDQFRLKIEGNTDSKPQNDGCYAIDIAEFDHSWIGDG